MLDSLAVAALTRGSGQLVDLTLKEAEFRRAIVGSRHVPAAAFSIMRTSASPRIPCRLRCLRRRCRNIAGTLPGRRDAAGSSAASSFASGCPPADDEVAVEGANIRQRAGRDIAEVMPDESFQWSNGGRVTTCRAAPLDKKCDFQLSK